MGDLVEYDEIVRHCELEEALDALRQELKREIARLRTELRGTGCVQNGW